MLLKHAVCFPHWRHALTGLSSELKQRQSIWVSSVIFWTHFCSLPIQSTYFWWNSCCVGGQLSCIHTLALPDVPPHPGLISVPLSQQPHMRCWILSLASWLITTRSLWAVYLIGVASVCIYTFMFPSFLLKLWKCSLPESTANWLITLSGDSKGWMGAGDKEKAFRMIRYCVLLWKVLFNKASKAGNRRRTVTIKHCQHRLIFKNYQ